MSTGLISLTFDDGLHEHLDHALPVLDRAGLAGTFYVHLTSPALLDRQPEWRRAADTGHELGNHTIFHPADARKKWVRPGNAIDEYSLDRMRLELELANRFLSTLDERAERTFAYPCSNSYVGRRGWVRRGAERIGLERTRVAGWIDRWGLDWRATRQSYEPIVNELFVAARGGGLEIGQPIPPTSAWRRTMLPSVAVDNWTLSELQNHVTNAQAKQTWAILQFHGIGGGHALDCSKTIFAEFVAWLCERYSDSVVTVLEGAQRLWPPSTAAPSGGCEPPDCGIHEHGTPTQGVVNPRSETIVSFAPLGAKSSFIP